MTYSLQGQHLRRRVQHIPMPHLRRNKRAARRRDYLCVSDAKLDVLYEEVSAPARKRFAAEVKVDFKIIGVKVKDAADKESVRIGPLSVVERFIEEHVEVGTIDNPGS